jgi:hypothetical protein
MRGLLLREADSGGFSVSESVCSLGVSVATIISEFLCLLSSHPEEVLYLPTFSHLFDCQ